MLDGPRIVRKDIDRMGELLSEELRDSGHKTEHGYGWDNHGGPWRFYIRSGENGYCIGHVLIQTRGARAFFDQMDAAKSALWLVRYDGRNA